MEGELQLSVRWSSSIPQIASEDIISLGNGRNAHFRRDRRFAQVQVVFTAPEGIDPNPGRELTDQFKELGWKWRCNEPGKPWIYQLEQSSCYDPTARGDSRDALHEQFLIIIEEYRRKHGLAVLSNNDECLKIIETQKLPSERRETRAGEMFDAFASVGAGRFDLTLTNLAGDKIAFRRSISQLHDLPSLLQTAADQQHNVIIRPRSSIPLIQLDDLHEDAAARLQPVSFLLLRTSPGSYQAWVAVSDADAHFARHLRESTGADLTASGACRVAGSLNFKPKYAPHFPTIETIHASPGLVVTRANLQSLGIVSPIEKPLPAVAIERRSPRGWPSYQRCLEGAPKIDEERRDRSRADYTFCLLALDWGWGIDETAARLMQVSEKAQENGEAYALRTAKAAAEGVERRGGRRR